MFEYNELCVLLKNLIPLEQNPEDIPNKRDAWEQTKLNSAIRKLEIEATKMRVEETKARPTPPALTRRDE